MRRNSVELVTGKTIIDYISDKKNNYIYPHIRSALANIFIEDF